MKPKMLLFLLFSFLYGCWGESYSPFIATRDSVINNKIQGTWIAGKDNSILQLKIFSVGANMWCQFSDDKDSFLVPLTFDKDALQGFFQAMNINTGEESNIYALYHYRIENNQLKIRTLEKEAKKYIAEHNDIKIDDRNMILKGYGSQAYQAIVALPMNDRFYSDAVRLTKLH